MSTEFFENYKVKLFSVPKEDQVDYEDFDEEAFDEWLDDNTVEDFNSEHESILSKTEKTVYLCPGDLPLREIASEDPTNLGIHLSKGYDECPTIVDTLSDYHGKFLCENGVIFPYGKDDNFDERIIKAVEDCSFDSKKEYTNDEVWEILCKVLIEKHNWYYIDIGITG